MSSIEWCDRTWNPIVHRGMAPQHRGLTVMRNHGPGWTGEVRLVPERRGAPLGWRKPQRVFVNSLSDLFHEQLSNEAIAAVFGVMAACPQHTFQVLTKRPERMLDWFAWAHRFGELRADALRRIRQQARWSGVDVDQLPTDVHANGVDWPLPNVWLGVSVEDQKTADDRIPHLLETPAVLRWVSYEPGLGPINWRRVGAGAAWQDALRFGAPPLPDGWVRGLDWIIVGGESGPGARPFDLAWARSTIAQCRAAGVPVFTKQLGAKPYESVSEATRGMGGVGLALRNRKGGDMAEWPEDLRVREMPEVSR